jgi:hypothetical protein
MVESFWAIPDSTTLRTPASILREQAAALTEQTKGVIVGSVDTRAEAGKLYVILNLTVPALNDYRYRVLTYEQPIELYPGRLAVSAAETTMWVSIGDEGRFVAEIRRVLSSEKVKNILTSLLAQAVEA